MSSGAPPIDGLDDVGTAANRELAQNILPFWESHAFDSRGYLVAEVDDQGTVSHDGPRHTVLISRILWTFSEATRREDSSAMRERWLAVAMRAHALLVGPCWDSTHGGVYWSLDNERAPLSTRKQVYAQAFAIYALIAWFEATGDTDALTRAWSLFEAVERHSRDRVDGGYIEAHARDWSGLPDMRLSPRDLNSQKSMNTMLHVIEAYTALTRATRDDRATEALTACVTSFLDHVTTAEPAWHCRLFFAADWTSLTDGVSYGHDIEASWLLWDAAEAIGDEALSARVREVSVGLADAVLATGADDDGGIVYEASGGRVTEAQKEWWPQAEAVVGWLNAFALTGEERYKRAAVATWTFIEEHVVDREGGEWFAVLDRSGAPMPTHPGSRKIGPWKCPYHNGRACIEIARRTLVR